MSSPRPPAASGIMVASLLVTCVLCIGESCGLKAHKDRSEEDQDREEEGRIARYVMWSSYLNGDRVMDGREVVVREERR